MGAHGLCCTVSDIQCICFDDCFCNCPGCGCPKAPRLAVARLNARFRRGSDGRREPDVIEGTLAPEDAAIAAMREAGFPVASAGETRAARAGAEQWAQDFAAASRTEDGRED